MNNTLKSEIPHSYLNVIGIKQVKLARPNAIFNQNMCMYIRKVHPVDQEACDHLVKA